MILDAFIKNYKKEIRLRESQQQGLGKIWWEQLKAEYDQEVGKYWVEGIEKRWNELNKE